MEGEFGEPESSLQEMKDKIREELELMKDALMSVSIEKEPTLHDNQSVDALIKTKLHIASEIEATMRENMLELPDNEELLVKVAEEEAEKISSDNARSIELYQEKIQQLEVEKETYAALVQKATIVNNKLDTLLVDYTKKDKLETMKRRFEFGGLMFKSLRAEMQRIMNDFYPDQKDWTSMDNLLESLIGKLLNDPQDPYIVIEDDVPEDYVAFLLRASIIVRHPQDVLKIRFVDPRY